MRRKAAILTLLIAVMLTSGLSQVFASPGSGSVDCFDPGIYVHDINLIGRTLYKNGSPRYTLTANVFIRDEDGNPVEGASVKTYLRKPNYRSRIHTRTTNAAGRVFWKLLSKKAGSWAVCVTWVAKSGYMYRADMNKETCVVYYYP